MKTQSSNINRIFKKMILIISIFLISFFANSSVNAAYFKYSDFNWDEFAEKNKKYWLTDCESSDKQKKCEDKILKQQKKFYTKLYKLLAKFEKKGVVGLNDNVILATVFFEIPFGYVVDNDGENKDDYGKITNSNAASYDDDNQDIDAYDVSTNDASALAQRSDTLKLLVKNMVGYSAACYGVSPKVERTAEDGTLEQVCENGSEADEYSGNCKTLINTGERHLGFWEKALESIQSFFGMTSNKAANCQAEASAQGYSSFSYEVSDTLEKAEDRYWEFLTKSTYLEGIPHLKYRFKNSKTGNYDLSDEEKIAVNTQIVKEIQELVRMYESSSDMYNANYGEITEYNYYFPIGSRETEEIDGILYAKKDPVSTNIISKFGEIKTQDGNKKRKNFGIDIGSLGNSGDTYVIAIEGGTVTYVKKGCTENEEKSKICNSGYGNMITISHSDGNKSIYGFLAPDSITVEEGDVVNQGQVIAKAGKTGDTDVVALHFEIRTGNSTASAVDPLDYLDVNNPRPTTSTKLAAFLASLEGTGPTDGDNYVVYCIDGDIPTVGHGITLGNNVPQFAQVGITVSSPFSQYCGKSYPKTVIDQVYNLVLKKHQNNVKNSLAQSGISNLVNHQVDALTSLEYNTGNLNGFASAYNTYSSSDRICTGFWHEHIIMRGSIFETGLRNRRKKECNLFVHGDYGV